MNSKSYILMSALALSVLSVSTPNTLSAQADILLQLRSGSPPGDRFRVDSAGGVVGLGRLAQGIIPASGAGVRMMWYPFKASFRVGEAGATQWDESNNGFYSFASGLSTTASGTYSFAHGDRATASGLAAIAFGTQTVASGTASFAVGDRSTCSDYACIAMGFAANAAGQTAIAIGYRTTADADYSLAMGYRASTNGHTGAMVFSDASTTDSLEASANNQFSVRAAGGYRLYTNATTTVGVSINAGGSTWNVISDRNQKENFRALNGEDILRRLRKVPMSSWNYKAEGKTVRHIGPMAQDWNKAFPLNDDNLRINMGDLDGVNLAAAQALEVRTAEQAKEITTLRSEIAELKARQAEMEKKQAALLRLLEKKLSK